MPTWGYASSNARSGVMCLMMSARTVLTSRFWEKGRRKFKFYTIQSVTTLLGSTHCEVSAGELHPNLSAVDVILKTTITKGVIAWISSWTSEWERRCSHGTWGLRTLVTTFQASFRMVSFSDSRGSAQARLRPRDPNNRCWRGDDSRAFYLFIHIRWITTLRLLMSSDLGEAGLVAVFDHTDEVGGSGRHKLGPERPHDWIQQQGTMGNMHLCHQKDIPILRLIITLSLNWIS